MKSAELRFEYNFLAHSKDDPRLAELYELADKLLVSYEAVSEADTELLNVEGLLERWINHQVAIEATKAELADLKQHMDKLNAFVKKAKEFVKDIEKSMPTKFKAAAKVVKDGRERFLKLSSEMSLDFDSLPVLKKVVTKLSGTE
jgi:hypothetical protein